MNTSRNVPSDTSRDPDFVAAEAAMHRAAKVAAERAESVDRQRAQSEAADDTGKTETKTLVFSFDGTGNEPSDAGEFREDESVSNVLKLHILMGGGVEEDRSQTETPNGTEQKTFYYNGIGTREGNTRIPLLGKLYSKGRSFVNMAIAPSFGDARRILDEARTDFDAAGYRPGDKLAIFGFSRGAALARKFASMILHDNRDSRVSFLGVFDTVAAMNGIHRQGDRISSDVVFENGTLNERIEKAVHLVAVDEDRVSFSPTLMNKDDINPERIMEVWFPGVHSDIGGGYWLDGLSDVALQFMIIQCEKTLGADISIVKGTPDAVPKLLENQGDAIAGLDADDIVVHPLIDGPLHAHTGLMAAALDQDVRNICVNDNDRPSKDMRDLPVLHVSVARRFARVSDYRPAALRGLNFKLLLDDGDKSDPLRGISGLRAYCESNLGNN